MNVFSLPGRQEIDKFKGVVAALPHVWDGSVLDVGCRSQKLRLALPDGTERYRGVDLYPPADVLGSLDRGLPFATSSFDTVVALDVLEHTDNIYGAFAELCRVARKWVLVALPNCYEWRLRLRFLLGRPISGKYGLPPEAPSDRHRWLFSLEDARRFVRARAQQHQFVIVQEACLATRRKLAFVTMWPGLVAPTYVSLLERQAAVASVISMGSKASESVP